MVDLSPPQHAVRLAVKNLSLTQFRSYARLSLDVGPEPVVLTGENGAGKTNLLEALSLLAPGRGLRRARLSDLCQRGADTQGWAVAAILRGPNGCINIGTGDITGTSGRRNIRIDGVDAAGQKSLAEQLHVIWLTPRMDRLFIDAPSARRRFFDRLVAGFDPGHGHRLAAYQRCMRKRAQILRAYRVDSSWLNAIEETMSEYAVAVAAARCGTLARLNVLLKAPFGSLFPGAILELEGSVESWLIDMPAVEAEERLRVALAEARAHDMETGGATLGPHRTDLLVRHIDYDLPAGQCSTGEQKMLLVSIVLAHAQAQTQRSGQTPLILLDEVMAHLDAAHRDHLIDALCALGAQTWLTGVEADLFSSFASRAQFLTISEGRIIDFSDRKLA